MNRIDRTLTELARRQHGLITRQQALFHGLSRTQVQWRLDTGQWLPARRAVYRVAGVPDSPESIALAACLAAPDGCRASYLTAAWVDGAWSAPPPIPHLTVPYGRSTQLAGAVVHRARLGPTDGVTRRGIPITSPARTLIDCASLLGPHQLQQVADALFHQRLITVRAVAHAWDLARLQPGRAGEVKLRAVLEPWTGSILPGSPAEHRLHRTLVQWGFPEPEKQVPVYDEHGCIIARVDTGWAGRKVGIEYDSERHHGPDQWQHDEQRHAAITALGWQLLHADKVDLVPGERRLRDALDRAWLASAGARR